MFNESSIKTNKKSKKRKHETFEHEDESHELNDKEMKPKFEDKLDQQDEDELNYKLSSNEESSNDEDKKIDLNQKSNQIIKPYSCIEHLHKLIKFPLLPIAINQEIKVIRQILIYKWKYNFIYELNGFLDYFDNLEVETEDDGKMMDDLPFIYYYITADFYVFRPKEGEYLRAKISCFEDLNKVINCSTNYDLTIFIQLPEEISDKLNKYLKLHQEIIFLIKTIDYSKMSIEGTINKFCIKLMDEYVEIVNIDESEQDNQNESNFDNLDNFFAD